jgi:hypothetical protein
MNRIALLQSKTTPQHLGLEIGPYFAPIFPKKDGWNVRSVDVFTSEELIERAKLDPSIGENYINIEPVDYVFKGSLYHTVIQNSTTAEAEAISSGSGLFDYIVSSHNFEHQPNPIQFLIHCSQLLKLGGSLTLAVPIGTRCFDRMRPLSTTGQIIDAYVTNSTKPTPGQIVDHFLNIVSDTNSEVPIHHKYYRSDQLQMPNATSTQKWNPDFYNWIAAIKDSDPYVDSHCWIFNIHSIKLILADLAALGIVSNMKPIDSWDLGSEFIITLVKTDEPLDELPNRCFLSTEANHYYVTDLIRLKPFQLTWESP